VYIQHLAGLQQKVAFFGENTNRNVGTDLYSRYVYIIRNPYRTTHSSASSLSIGYAYKSAHSLASEPKYSIQTG